MARRTSRYGLSVVACTALLVTGVLAVSQGGAAQIDTTADRVFGQDGDFSTNGINVGGVSSGSLNYAIDVAVDSGGNLYVADIANNRVLEYDSPLTTDQIADRVFGQGDGFATNDSNHGGLSARSLRAPSGVALDSAGNLYIVDSDNNRVLQYDDPLTADTEADRVFGQFDIFTSAAQNNGGISRDSLSGPIGAAVDAAGNLYVSDALNHRVLEYDAPLTTDTRADRVFGQGGDFAGADENHGGLSAASLSYPNFIAIDEGGRLYVADTNNNRVLEYDDPLTTDTLADRVFGQGGSFTSGDGDKGGQSASSLFEPLGVAVDRAGNVYVTDGSNNRVLEYDGPVTTDVAADRVFGQHGSFSNDTANSGGISADSLRYPTAVVVDSAGNVYVADFNSRVLEYDNPLGLATPTPTSTPMPTPTSTQTAGPSATPGATRAMGDVDCDGEITTRDNQAELRFVLDQNPLSQTEPCPDIGADVVIDDTNRVWGDEDCDGEVTTRDNQAKLRFVLQQNVLSQTEPCVDVGDPLT